MFSYFLARWRFNRAFEPDGDDFLYRRNPRSASIRVSKDEHSAFLKKFRKKYFKYHSVMFAVCFGMTIAIISLLVLLTNDFPETAVVVATYALGITFIVGTLLVDRHLFNEPVKALSERAHASPRRTWKDVSEQAIVKASWPKLIASALVISVLGWATFPSSTSPVWWPYAWTAYFGLCGVLAVRNIWKKLHFTKGS